MVGPQSHMSKPTLLLNLTNVQRVTKNSHMLASERTRKDSHWCLTYVTDVVRNLIIASGRLKKHEIIPTGVEPYQSGMKNSLSWGI